MDLIEYCTKYDLNSKREIEKVVYMAFFYINRNRCLEFNTTDIKNWFYEANLSIPNIARLEKKMKSSKDFIRGSSTKKYKLHQKCLTSLQSEINDVEITYPQIKSDSSILPDTLLEGKRSYIQSFGHQINSSFTNGIFDGCAVLMRRLVEICLIHTYENLNIESAIKNSEGKYRDLKQIIKDATINPLINLTYDSKLCLDSFRDIGNLSAHQLYYNCKFEEINRVKIKFRLLIEELFNKAGIKVEK